jgi:hypothetical protein
MIDLIQVYTPAQLAQLKSLGFSDAHVETPRRLIASVAGLAKTGKTHFCLTAPDPIIFFNIDIGTEGVVGKFQEAGKQIFIYDIRVPKQASQDTYMTMWNDYKHRLSVAYTMGKGTVITDTGSEAYDLARLAHFGKLTQILPQHYTLVNTDWREVMRLAYDSDMNTIFIHKMKAKWVNNQRTNEYESAGFSEMSYMTQINIVTHKEQGESGPDFSTEVIDCRQNPNIGGTVLRGPMNDFKFLLSLVHGR